jgi:glycine/D-amino acid oxidase-like deaminating enzyme
VTKLRSLVKKAPRLKCGFEVIAPQPIHIPFTNTRNNRDPLRLSQFLLSQCLERGVQLHNPAKAISVSKDMRDDLSSVRIASTDSSHEIDIPCTHLVIAAGAWSPKVFRTLFPDAKIELPISSLAGHSLVVRSPRWTSEHEKRGCHAVFTTDEAGYSPEIFSRMGGEIYVAGLNSTSIPLPALATESKIDDSAVKQLLATSKRLLSVSSNVDLEILRKGLCFRPVTNKGTPILARIPDKVLGGGMSTRGGGSGGVYLTAGHGPWGISMGLGTGKVMAEMVFGLETSADVKGLGL